MLETTICGTSDSKLREGLLREADLILDKRFQISRVPEIAKERAKTIASAKQAHRINLKEPRRQNKDRKAS